MKATGAPVRVGILSFAHPHVFAYTHNLLRRGVQVVGTDTGHYDEGTARGRELAQLLGIEYVDSIQELLAQNLDGVIVASENAHHREHIETVLDSRIPILCEKPLATTAADATAILDKANALGVSVMTAYPVRFAPAFRQLVHAVRQGELGEILSITGTNNGKIPLGDRSWFVDENLAGGGALMDHIVHCADLIDELLGEQASDVFASVNAMLHAERGVEVETGGVASISYPSGVIATIDCSWSQPDSAPTWGGLTLEVHGTKGSMRIDPFAIYLGGYDAKGEIWLPTGADLDQLMIDAFLSSLDTGIPAQPDGTVGLRTLAMATAAQRSVATRFPEHLHR